MAHSTSTAATFYKDDEETRRMIGSMELGLGLGLGVGMGLSEEEAVMVEQVKEDPELTGETQMMNETQFIFEFPGQEEENTHNTTVEHETHSPSSEYLLPIPFSSSLSSFHPDSSPLQSSPYNTTSVLQDHTHRLASTSSVVTTTAVSAACIPPLRTGSPTTEAMRSMMSVFRVDPFASYDIDAGSRRKRRKRGSTYAMLSDPEQTSREEPLMFTFQIDGMQDNDYDNFNHLDSTSVMLDGVGGSLSIPSSPSMNMLSSYSSTLPNYNTFLHSESDDLSNMVLHTSGETISTTTVTTTGGGSGTTTFGSLYTSYSPSPRHHHYSHSFHNNNINMIGTNMQRHSYLHHSSGGSSSNPSLNTVSNPNLSSTNYMLQNMQHNVGFNLDIGTLGMSMNTMPVDVSMNTTTASFHNPVPGTNPPVQIPIPGVSPLSATSVPMNLGLPDTDANIDSSTSNNNNTVSSMDHPLSVASISDFGGGIMVAHHFSEEEEHEENNSWHSSQSHRSYHPSHHHHHHSPSQQQQQRYQRHYRNHQSTSRHNTTSSQSQNQGFGNRLADKGEKQLRFPLDLSLTKLGRIHGDITPQSISIPESGQEENKSQVDHSQGHDEEHQSGEDKGNHRDEPQETPELDQNQIIEYDNIQVENVRGINSGLEFENLDLTLKTEINQLEYPSPLSEDNEEENEYEKDRRDGRQNEIDSDQVLKVGFESGSKGRGEEKLETRKRKREHETLENGHSLKIPALSSCSYSPKAASTDGVDKFQRIRHAACGCADDTVISSPAPSVATQTHSTTNSTDSITQSSFDFNSFPLSSRFDVDYVDNDLVVDDHDHHERDEKSDIQTHEIPKRETLITSRPASGPSSTWTGSGGGLVFLPAAASPEHGDGHGDDEDQNKGENDGDIGFWNRDVGSPSLELELEFEPGSRPGMEACSGPHPGLMFPQCDQWSLNHDNDGDATASKFISSPQKSSSAVSSSSSVETSNQIQLPKLHYSNNQFQGSGTHTLNYYNPDDHYNLPVRFFPITHKSEYSVFWIIYFPDERYFNEHQLLLDLRFKFWGFENAHICPIPTCSKTFAVRSNARRHLRIHGSKIGSSTDYNADDGSDCSPPGASFSPSKLDRGRERSLSPFTSTSLSRQNSDSQRHQISLQYNREKEHPYKYPCTPPHSYLESRQSSHQFLRSEDGRPLSPSPEQERSIGMDESKSNICLYDYYVKENSYGVENEYFVPGTSEGTNQSSTLSHITAISPQLIFSQQNFIASTTSTSDTRPSSTSSMTSNSTSSSDSSMHTPNSFISEDPTVSINPSVPFKHSEPFETRINAHIPRSISNGAEMRDVNPPSSSLPSGALISMPIPQARFGSSSLRKVTKFQVRNYYLSLVLVFTGPRLYGQTISDRASIRIPPINPAE
ncbi:hypothetical protein Clacol_009202 [Clathrus columnatus]|uniref:C2H2-type domain-containing protein n=1 Tax=Clathrus columnatus TaxID=1419009 RepID=A0AAV5AMC5_9AGAM|nr:hypothetical protein Clacol_009202 [Clathrus columnatus]